MIHTLWMMFFPCGQSLESGSCEIGWIGPIGSSPGSRYGYAATFPQTFPLELYVLDIGQ